MNNYSGIGESNYTNFYPAQFVVFQDGFKIIHVRNHQCRNVWRSKVSFWPKCACKIKFS